MRFRFFHLPPVAIAGVEQHQLRLSLQPGGQLLAILPAKPGHAFTSGFAGAIEQRRHHQQGEQHNTAEGQGQRDVQHAQPHGDDQDHHQRPYQRRYNAQIEMIQGIDIGNHPVEQLALTKTRQPGWGERQQLAEGKDPQVLQDAEGGIMANQTLKVAACGANNRRAAYAGGRQHIVKAVDARYANHGGCRQEPARQR